MATGTEFDAAAMAAWYAKRHAKADRGVLSIDYLPHGSPEREIRLLEVNKLVVELTTPLEPLSLGSDAGYPERHTLSVLDVTPAQWGRIEAGELALPAGWSLADSVALYRRRA